MDDKFQLTVSALLSNGGGTAKDTRHDVLWREFIDKAQALASNHKYKEIDLTMTWTAREGR